MIPVIVIVSLVYIIWNTVIEDRQLVYYIPTILMLAFLAVKYLNITQIVKWNNAVLILAILFCIFSYNDSINYYGYSYMYNHYIAFHLIYSLRTMFFCAVLLYEYTQWTGFGKEKELSQADLKAGKFAEIDKLCELGIISKAEAEKRKGEIQ